MRRATVEQTKSDINTARYTVLEAGTTVYKVESNYISRELMTPLYMRDGRKEYSSGATSCKGQLPSSSRM